MTNAMRLAFAVLLVFSVLAFSAVEYRDGKVIFTFKTDVKANVVYLAGTFNNWNPTAWPMKLVDGVWRYEIELKPGRYEYKYVIDGKNWKEDPEAPAFVDDGYGGKNGAFVLTPEGKILPPDGASKQAGVSTGKSYELNPKRMDTIFVDPDGYVIIRFYAKDAKYIFIAGTFNNWNDKATEVYFIEDGWWEAILELQPGIYEYKFVVDGKWITDPNAFAFVDDGFGGKNGVFEVYREGGKLKVGAPRVAITPAEKLEEVKVQGIKPGLSIVDGKVFFAVKNDRAQEAYLAGTFNSWNPTALKMKLVDGYWTASLQLSPGTYEYKYVFIIGGNQVWQEDPNAPSYKPDGYGGKNGVFKLVSKDGQLIIEGIEEQAGGLPVKGKYEFDYTFKLDQSKYLVGSSTMGKLTLRFEPVKDSFVELTYAGASISKATLKFDLGNFTLGMHYRTPWSLPVGGSSTGLVVGYKIGSIQFFGGLGHESTGLPWAFGVGYKPVEVYVGHRYFDEDNYSIVAYVELDKPIKLSFTGLYNFNNTYYLEAAFETEQFGVNAYFDGITIGLGGFLDLSGKILEIATEYDLYYGDFLISGSYELTEDLVLDAGFEISSSYGLSIGLTKFFEKASVRVGLEMGDILNPFQDSYLKISGKVSF
ncbi:glycoside hydrolase family 13 [Fervidobacterium thailandense]|uniref:Glycoside hydrolase family 13 n=1 Tax=Fervidobacterium thailandense TaxID=1008305 RepID=A0A1E3G0L7_9BACT|nr:glycoside hydrolase family 13 [Fervidobacterium thailandense]ODN29804.1 glycoside hydrolase family 13 [Fervidobacterium thailandense]